MSNALSRDLNKYDGEIKKNGRPWETLVDYTLEDLIAHLEAQFTPEMTWENYGTVWHLDHIIPIAAFHYTSTDDEQFKACWSLSNLQPLPAEENIKKADTLPNGERARNASIENPMIFLQ